MRAILVSLIFIVSVGCAGVPTRDAIDIPFSKATFEGKTETGYLLIATDFSQYVDGRAQQFGCDIWLSSVGENPARHEFHADPEARGTLLELPAGTYRKDGMNCAGRHVKPGYETFQVIAGKVAYAHVWGYHRGDEGDMDPVARVRGISRRILKMAFEKMSPGMAARIVDAYTGRSIPVARLN